MADVNASQLAAHVVGKVYVRKISRRSPTNLSGFQYRSIKIKATKIPDVMKLGSYICFNEINKRSL